MASPRHYALIWRHACVVSLLVASGWQSAIAADHATEREQLAAISRQLELLDRLVEHAADVSPQGRARYHFDYVRLREDVKRVHAGVQDYLVPQRAQPRDPIPLSSNYVRSDSDMTDGKEASKP
ncbi:MULTISPECIES: integrative conjugative element protein, RAQPRD family [Pseudomonadota]|uniref:integrative conjugative element protein, RAQPRD family n=1 Tax=Pseudomonadota TaxID=1224 RepID=UPI0001D23557|nr:MULTISPECIES: RAQPRD family integrative conjugative element protein [Pseudomonadota]EIF29975.1 integrative conjugative element protein, RAQPRD family [Burkholderia sp. Ch1-1]ERY96107.1 raqprd family integrative conjugative element protein [Pseudomonas aeruginosa BWHPSA009]